MMKTMLGRRSIVALFGINAIVRAWRFAAGTIEDAPECFPIGPSLTGREEFLSLHCRDFFCGGNDKELVHAGSVALADLLDGRLEREWQPQWECPGPGGHELILFKASVG